jgi:hypothetical protein
MKTGPDAVGTAENESGNAKYENGTCRPRDRRNETTLGAQNKETCPGTQNMKTGPDALGTAENEFERAKHENGN